MTAKTITMTTFYCLNGVESRETLSYPIIYSDAGRSQSKRPKQSNDCAVRALALARNLPYDEAYDLLAEAGRKCSRGFHLQKWLPEQPWVKKLSFQAVKGQRRMNPARFCAEFKTGTFICRVAKHVFVVKDGVVFDTYEERPDRCIYTAFEIT